MTRALLLSAHPLPDGYGAALRDAIRKALAARGWTVDDCDLYAERFDPVLTEAERRGYHDVPANLAPVAAYVDRLRAADALVLSFPVWNYGYPAILKGFLDRVFLPDVSFTLRDGRLAPALTNVRRLAAVTTYGGSWWRTKLAGDPPRACVMRQVRWSCQPRVCRYLALHDMNNADQAKRDAFLARASRAMAAL